MRYISLSIVCLLILCQLSFADDKSDVADILKGKVDIVLSILNQKDLDKQKRNQIIIDIVAPMFDFDTMAKLSLGKRHWPSLGKGREEEFSSLFTKRLQESYLEKLDIYDNEEVVYEDPQQMKNKIHIMTRLVSKGDSMDILYKFYKTDARWQIYDVEFQGVSVIQTYRSQFDGILKDGTIDDLMARLRKKNEFSVPGVKKRESTSL